MADPGKPKLHYFPYSGRAEVLRMAMQYFELDYDEEVVSSQAWVSLKRSGNYEFAHLPMLEIQGKRLVQTSAILRYLCQTNHAYSTSTDQIAQIEAIVELHSDIQAQTLPLMLQDKLTEAKAWYEVHMPEQYFPMIERLLEANGAGQGKYFVGSTVTMADFVMFEFGFDAFQRSQMEDLGVKFAPIAPKFFAFLATFKEQKQSLKRYMSEHNDKPV